MRGILHPGQMGFLYLKILINCTRITVCMSRLLQSFLSCSICIFPFPVTSALPSHVSSALIPSFCRINFVYSCPAETGRRWQAIVHRVILVRCSRILGAPGQCSWRFLVTLQQARSTCRRVFSFYSNLIGSDFVTLVAGVM